jgi:hypothetical protein
MKRDLRVQFSFSATIKPNSDIDRRFRALAADVVSKRVRPNGLTGIRIYRDSQFEFSARELQDPTQRELAHQAFCEEFSKRLCERFRDHPLAKAGLLV